MRKRLKNKRRSCGLCKPYKRGMDIRWKPRQLFLLKISEEEIAENMKEKGHHLNNK